MLRPVNSMMSRLKLLSIKSFETIYWEKHCLCQEQCNILSAMHVCLLVCFMGDIREYFFAICTLLTELCYCAVKTVLASNSRLNQWQFHQFHSKI